MAASVAAAVMRFLLLGLADLELQDEGMTAARRRLSQRCLLPRFLRVEVGAHPVGTRVRRRRYGAALGGEPGGSNQRHRNNQPAPACRQLLQHSDAPFVPEPRRPGALTSRESGYQYPMSGRSRQRNANTRPENRPIGRCSAPVWRAPSSRALAAESVGLGLQRCDAGVEPLHQRLSAETVGRRLGVRQ